MADGLFDTTVFLDYRRGDREAISLMTAVFSGSFKASYSPITIFEIWIGIDSHEEETDFLGILNQFEHAPLTASMARTAAVWLRGLDAPRSESLFRDALIAATAVERDEPTYTRNVRDFKRFYADVRSY